jgi:hypothetical protein
MSLRQNANQARRKATTFGPIAASLLLIFAVAACKPAPESSAPPAPETATPSPEVAVPAAPATVPSTGWPVFATRQSVKDAFDRQADTDKTDRTFGDCPDVHGVMSCSFVIDAFKRDVPEEAAVFKGPNGEMPDEVMDIAGLNSEPVTTIGLDGNGASPARRYHYIGQFKTLMRILSPGIGTDDLDTLIEELQLGATPQTEVRSAATRPFASLTCTQGGGKKAFIHCQAEAPKK